MEQKKERLSDVGAPGSDKPDMRSAEQMQEDNATGAMQNEQGQASFITGSTTGGGSNFGQGSSHLGGHAYRQGDRTGAGSNYANEGEGLGNSDIGTSEEGTAAAVAATGSQTNSRLAEDDRSNTGLKGDSNPHEGWDTRSSGRPRSSWSQSSTSNE